MGTQMDTSQPFSFTQSPSLTLTEDQANTSMDFPFTRLPPHQPLISSYILSHSLAYFLTQTSTPPLAHSLTNPFPQALVPQITRTIPRSIILLTGRRLRGTASVLLITHPHCFTAEGAEPVATLSNNVRWLTDAYGARYRCSFPAKIKTEAAAWGGDHAGSDGERLKVHAASWFRGVVLLV